MVGTLETLSFCAPRGNIGHSKVDNAVKVEPVGEFELKGIRRPLAAYNVLGAVSAGA